MMTAAQSYTLGVAIVVAVGSSAAALAPVELRPAFWCALGLGSAVQAPLGWAVVRSLGSERFLLAWAAGVGARLALLAIAAVVIAPRLGLTLGPFLFALVGVLMAFVAVEALVPRERVE